MEKSGLYVSRIFASISFVLMSVKGLHLNQSIKPDSYLESGTPNLNLGLAGDNDALPAKLAGGKGGDGRRGKGSREGDGCDKAEDDTSGTHFDKWI